MAGEYLSANPKASAFDRERTLIKATESYAAGHISKEEFSKIEAANITGYAAAASAISSFQIKRDLRKALTYIPRKIVRLLQ